MPHRLSSALAVVAVATALTACGGGDPAATCGVPNATQACACPDGSTAGQTCQTSGAWTTCGCATVDPLCVGVACDNGGACAVRDGAAVCDCPAGTFGAGCGGVCPAEPQAAVACASSFASDRWYATVDGASVCLVPETFAFEAPTATTVNLLIVRADGGATPPSYTARNPMRDDDGDGRWAISILLTADVRWVYVFEVDGVERLDPNAPTDQATGASIHMRAACAALPAGAPQCGNLLREGDIGVTCPASGAPGCGADGGVDAWFGVTLTEPRVVERLRFRSDWWQKRPTAWELWAGDDGAQLPGAGARLVASGESPGAPWECVTGESCDDPAVPDACCPDGRTSPQRVAADGHIAKWDVHPIEDAVGRFFYLRVLGTQDGTNLILTDLAVEGHDCLTAGGEFPAPACEVGGVGVDAGCRAGEWCAPGRGPDAASPGCTTIGTVEVGRTCWEQRCEDTTADDCYLDAMCSVGSVCSRGGGVCEALCDPNGASCGLAMACTAATDGGATLPYGTCGRARCEHPFRAGECGAGAWCNPNWIDGVGGFCVATGDAKTGERCEESCAANNLCTGGFCEAICASDGTFPDAPSCAAAMVCTVLGDSVSVGMCRTPCQVGADTCPAQSFCDPPELSFFDTPVCSPTPASWPDDGGIAAGEDCTGARCGPLTSCFGVDEDQNGSVDFSRCYGRCRTSVAPFGADHPDCPAAAPDCVHAVGDLALGACLPKG